MGQPITDHAAFFASAGRAVEELEALNTEVEQLEADEKKLESSLKGKQRSVTETISQTVKQRKEEITKSYDAELGKAQDRLKKVRAKREKAKNQGVKERIEEDTRGLVRENKELADQMKTLFKANHVPGFCRGSYYYALYFTRTFGTSHDDHDLLPRDPVRSIFPDPGETDYVSRGNLCCGDPDLWRDLCNDRKHDQGALYGSAERRTWDPGEDPHE